MGMGLRRSGGIAGPPSASWPRLPLAPAESPPPPDVRDRPWTRPVNIRAIYDDEDDSIAFNELWDGVTPW